MHKQKLSRRHLRGGRLHSWFGDRLLHKDLWVPTPSSLARAWLIGFPITVTPFLPGQSVFATVGALLVRGNILLCVAMQFLSNPITAPVHLPICYLVGELVRGRTPENVWHGVANDTSHLLSGDAAVSLYLGAVVVGLLGGVIGYAVILRLWHRHVHHDPRKKHPRPPPSSAPGSP